MPFEDTKDTDLGHAPGTAAAQDKRDAGPYQIPLKNKGRVRGAGTVEMGPDGDRLSSAHDLTLRGKEQDKKEPETVPHRCRDTRVNDPK